MSQKSQNNWTNDPKLKNIDQSKLEMLLSMADQGKGKGPSEMLPLLMAAASQSKSNGMAFSTDEIDSIIEVLKMGKPTEEIEKMERIRNMMKLLK